MISDTGLAWTAQYDTLREYYNRIRQSLPAEHTYQLDVTSNTITIYLRPTDYDEYKQQVSKLSYAGIRIVPARLVATIEE